MVSLSRRPSTSRPMRIVVSILCSPEAQCYQDGRRGKRERGDDDPDPQEVPGRDLETLRRTMTSHSIVDRAPTGVKFGPRSAPASDPNRKGALKAAGTPPVCAPG